MPEIKPITPDRLAEIKGTVYADEAQPVINELVFNFETLMREFMSLANATHKIIAILPANITNTADMIYLNNLLGNLINGKKQALDS
jgi:hypothetical protein